MASAHPFEIRESPIHGKGVFATRGISKGDLVGVALRRVARTGDPDSDLRQTLLARYLNHSPDPNAAFVPIPGGFGLRALRDIPQGGEITADYAACGRAIAPEATPPQEEADTDMAHADPRIRVAGRVGPFAVVEVDGPSVRRDLDPEFTNFGHHLTFPFIPRGELWVDREAHPDEEPFFVRHMLVEHRLMASGAPRGEAMEIADRAERDERVRVLGRRKSDTPVEHPKIRVLGRLRSGISVWLVDGKAIRDTIHTDFTEGGNWLVYGWVPKGEIWIDNDVLPAERVFVLIHELAESLLMGRGLDYDKAHAIATRAEWARRMPRGGRERIPFPPRYRKALEKGTKTVTMRIGDEQGKYRKGMVLDAASYDGDDWGFRVEVLGVVTKPLSEMPAKVRGLSDMGGLPEDARIDILQIKRAAAKAGVPRRIRKWIRDNVSDPENHCFFYAAALAALFPGLTLVRGRHSGQHPGDTAHFWTEDEDGNIIDPTAAQYHGGEYSGGAPVSLEANLEDVVKDPLFKTLPSDDQERIVAVSALPLSGRHIGFRRYTAGLPFSKRASHLAAPPVVNRALQDEALRQYANMVAANEEASAEVRKAAGELAGSLVPNRRIMIDLTGWKYLDRIPKHLVDRMARTRLYVAVQNAPDEDATAGTFSADPWMVTFYIHDYKLNPESVDAFMHYATLVVGTAGHEARHLGQVLLKGGRGGMPSRRHSVPGASRTGDVSVRNLRSVPLHVPLEPHPTSPQFGQIPYFLRDIEFWPNVSSEVTYFVQVLMGAPLAERHAELKQLLNGTNEWYQSPFLAALRQYNPHRWREAVKAILSKVLSIPDIWQEEEKPVPREGKNAPPFSKRAKDHAYVGKRKEESGNITYLYDERHVAARNRKKEKRLQKLNKSLKRMRDKVRGDLSHEDEKIRLAALAVALIDETYERVGNEESASDLKHYGVTGWLVKHVSLGKGKAAIRYVGKAGVRQSKEVKNKAVLKALRRACEGKGKGDRVLDGIGAKDVNAYLAPFKVTAKDIRGYHANKEMLRSLKESGKPPKGDGKAAKERFGKALEDAAKRVGHEPGTLKRQYLIPRIEQYYMEGRSVGNILACGLPLPLSKRAEDDPREREEFLGRFPPDKGPAEQAAKDRPKRRRRTPEERRRIVEHRQEERRRQERLERELAERRETGDSSGFPQLDRLLREEASGIRLSKRAALMDIPPRMAGDATAWVRQAHANLCLALHRPLPPPAMVEAELAALKGLEEMAGADSLRLAGVAAGDLPELEEKMLPRWDGRRFWLRLSGSGRPVGLFFIARRIAPGRWAYGASVQEWRRNPPLVPPMVPGSGHTLAAVLGALAERIGNLTRERTPPTDRDYQRNADLEAALKEAAAGAPPLDMLQMDSSYSQERELPVDISGWKYGRLVTSGLPWGKYTLEVAAQAPRDATASYQRYRPATRTETKEVPERLPRIVVYAGRLLRPGSARMFRMEQEKLAEAVRHEMVHLAQDLLKGALRLKMLAGLPPMSVRERGLDPSGFARPSRRTLRRQRRLWPESTFTGHREDAMRIKHQLQDVEFQSNLRDSIEGWRRLAEPMDPIQRRKFLGFWVRGDEKGYLEAHGKGELPSVPFSQSDVFRTLHNEARHDRARRDKWAAAARMMAREVADMLEPERTASAMPLSRRAASARDEELTDLYRLAAAALGRAGGYGALKPGWQRLFDDMADALWRKDLRLANRIIGRIMGDVLGERPPQPARRMGGRAP